MPPHPFSRIDKWISEHFPKLKPLWRNVIIELDLSNYVSKADLKKVTGVDTSKFAKNNNLASLKLDVEKLDIDNLKIVSVDLSKLSNVVDSDVVRKGEYNKLVTNGNIIDTSGFVLKTWYNTDKSGLVKNINAVNKKNT